MAWLIQSAEATAAREAQPKLQQAAAARPLRKRARPLGVPAPPPGPPGSDVVVVAEFDPLEEVTPDDRVQLRLNAAREAQPIFAPFLKKYVEPFVGPIPITPAPKSTVAGSLSALTSGGSWNQRCQPPDADSTISVLFGAGSFGLTCAHTESKLMP